LVVAYRRSQVSDHCRLPTVMEFAEQIANQDDSGGYFPEKERRAAG
jgi:hypothetical protein